MMAATQLDTHPFAPLVLDDTESLEAMAAVMAMIGKYFIRIPLSVLYSIALYLLYIFWMGNTKDCRLSRQNGLLCRIKTDRHITGAL